MILHQQLDPNTPDNNRWYPIHEAANHGHVDVVEYLVKNGAKINPLAADDITPLMDAAASGFFNVVIKLLELKANPLCRDASVSFRIHYLISFD